MSSLIIDANYYSNVYRLLNHKNNASSKHEFSNDILKHHGDIVVNEIDLNVGYRLINQIVVVKSTKLLLLLSEDS